MSNPWREVYSQIRKEDSADFLYENSIWEEVKPANTPEKKGAAGGDNTAKKVRQAVYDIRYRARREDIPLPKAFTQYMSNTSMSPKERTMVRAKLMGEEYSEQQDVQEVAPPGAKFERMVKHIKKGYSDDGLTKKEKGITYATAWKQYNKEEVEELDEVSDRLAKAARNTRERRYNASFGDGGMSANYSKQNAKKDMLNKTLASRAARTGSKIKPVEEEVESMQEADSIEQMRARAAKRRQQRYGASDTSRGGRDDFRPYTQADYERGAANDPRKKVKEEVGQIGEEKDEKEKVRVTDKESNKSYVRYASKEKQAQLRNNPHVQSVERVDYGEPYEGERKSGKQTAKVAAGKGLDPVGREDKDIDNDGDHDKSDKYLLHRREVRGKAIASKTKKESFSNWRSEIADDFFLDEKRYPDSPHCEVMPDLKDDNVISKSKGTEKANKRLKPEKAVTKEDLDLVSEELGGTLLEFALETAVGLKATAPIWVPYAAAALGAMGVKSYLDQKKKKDNSFSFAGDASGFVEPKTEPHRPGQKPKPAPSHPAPKPKPAPKPQPAPKPAEPKPAPSTPTSKPGSAGRVAVGTGVGVASGSATRRSSQGTSTQTQPQREPTRTRTGTTTGSKEDKDKKGKFKKPDLSLPQPTAGIAVAKGSSWKG